MTSPEDIPRGLGIYCERGDSTGGALATGRLIDRMHRAGARHVGLCVEAIDGWRPGRLELGRVVDRLASADLRVHTYCLPGEPRARLGARVSEEHLNLTQGLALSGRILDGEEPFRGLAAQLRSAVEVLVDGATEASTVGVTFYGLPSEPGAFPWDALLGRGWAGWQCYLRAAQATGRRSARAGLEELRQHWGGALIPHVAGYKRKGAPVAGELDDGAARLLADLRRTCLDEDGRCDVPGAWVWAEGSLDGRELDALGGWVQRVGWA